MQRRNRPVAALLCATTVAGLLVGLFEVSRMNNEEQNQDFGKLQHLLKLKRYEQPPPGYFHNFSRQVCARIQDGKHAANSGVFGSLFSNASWLKRFWVSLETQPIFAGVLGMAACALLLTGIVYSTEKTDTPQAYIPASAIEASLGLRRSSSQDSVFEPPTLANFQLNNRFGDLASQGSFLPVQSINFTVPGNQ